LDTEVAAFPEEGMFLFDAKFSHTQDSDVLAASPKCDESNLLKEIFNPLAPEMDILIVAHHLCKM